MIVSMLTYLILALGVGFLIYKYAREAWYKVNREIRKKKLKLKLKNIEELQKDFKKVSRLDMEKLKEKKEKIEEVEDF